MITDENYKLTDNYFSELMPNYAKSVTYKFASNYYTDQMHFTRSESDDKIKQKFNHVLKGIVMKSEGEYLSEEEIARDYEICVRDVTSQKTPWGWCGIDPKDKEAMEKFNEKNRKSPTNKHYIIYFEVFIKYKSHGAQGTSGGGDMDAMFRATSADPNDCVRLW